MLFTDAISPGAAAVAASQDAPPTGHTFGGITTDFTGDDVEKDGAGCRYPGINLLGGDLSSQQGGHGIETNSPDHCRNECARRNECQFWTYVDKWKVNCYLKDKRGPGRRMEGATSGALFVSCGKC